MRFQARFKFIKLSMFRKCAGSLFQRVGAADVKDLSPRVFLSRALEQQTTVGSKTVFRYIFNIYQITYVFRREAMNRLESKNKYFKTNTILNG